MFSFARTVMDLIQSATGLKVKPSTINGAVDVHDDYGGNSPKTPKKLHSPVSRVPHTSIENALNSYRQSLKASQSLDTDQISTSLIEEDFVFAIQGYCANFTLRNGQEVIIRPLLPSDFNLMKECLENNEVSQESLSLRFNTVTFGVKDYMLKYFTNINYDTHFAIGAMIKEDGKWKGVATARFIEDSENPDIAEWAAIVVDKYHGLGIGSCLLYYIAYFASQCDIHKLCAIVHSDNYPVLHWMKKLDAQQLLLRDCRYWFFETPIFPSWVFDEATRCLLEKAATGESTLSEECLEVIRKNVHDLNLYESSQERKEDTSDVKIRPKIEKKKSTHKVTFVTAFEDDLDLGDLF